MPIDPDRRQDSLTRIARRLLRACSHCVDMADAGRMLIEDAPNAVALAADRWPAVP